MNGIISEIKYFYCYYHTSAELKRENPSEWVIKTSLCKRTDFVNAAFDGLAFLVYNVGLTIFSAIALVTTAGLIPSFKASFCKNAYEGIVHAGSIPVSIMGIIFPQTVNQNFLKLTVLEIKKGIEPGHTLTEVASILGGIVLRKRRPLR